MVAFGGHWYSAIGDITHLICRVTLQDQVIKGSYDFIGGSVI